MDPTYLRTQLSLTESFDADYLEFFQIFPLEKDGERLLVAASGEPDPEIIRDLEHTFGGTVELFEVETVQIADAVRRTFAEAESVSRLVARMSEDDLDLGADPHQEGSLDARDLANQPPVIRYVNLLIREAAEARASDIHLDSTPQGVAVRFRVDGVLSQAPAPPTRIQNAVVSRMKLMAELDIAERRVPQDGRVRIRLEDRAIDLRVSTVPTLFGESVVIRLLTHGDGPVELEDLGMAAQTQTRFEALCRKPHGIVLATGPTGSGKTTTLYTALGLREVTAEKIITVEDPVEYQLPGIAQVPVNRKAGMTFATGLRSILRQDPDVVMIGEMRDAETASIAVQAALTGHLVFSTLHTNDAASALTRLIDLGVEAYLIAATVEAVLAQRLVRRICPQCPETYEPDPSVLQAVTGVSTEGIRFLRGAGCNHCRGTGYLGRIGVYELMEISEGVRQQMLESKSVGALREKARDNGMVTLRTDGWQKVRAGLTTLEEVVRVVEG